MLGHMRLETVVEHRSEPKQTARLRCHMPAHRKYHDLPLVKTCPVCERDFPRPASYDSHRWLRAKVCSLACASKLSAAAKKAKQPSLEDAFAARIDTSPGQGPKGDCHQWTGSLDVYGYGRLKREGKAIKATHIALSIAGRPLPKGMMACHECDNPPCVRDEHLFHGTGAVNSQDKADKGRAPHGAAHHKARLTAEQVLAIRADERPYAQIAAQFGISTFNVTAIRLRKTWRHI